MGGHGGGGHGGGGHGGGGGFRGGGRGFVYAEPWPLDFYDPTPYIDTTVVVLNPDGTPAVIAGERPPHAGGGKSAKAKPKPLGRLAGMAHGVSKDRGGARQKRAASRHARLHGETAMAGATGSDEPNFGYDNSLEAAGGGLDPFGLASFGEDDDVTGSSGGDAGDLTADLGVPDADEYWPGSRMNMGAVPDYHFDATGRAGTLRPGIASAIGFEADYYSGVLSAAPIMGIEPVGPMSLIGCERRGGGMRG
jgi:hypothetical protein